MGGGVRGIGLSARGASGEEPMIEAARPNQQLSVTGARLPKTSVFRPPSINPSPTQLLCRSFLPTRTTARPLSYRQS